MAAEENDVNDDGAVSYFNEVLTERSGSSCMRREMAQLMEHMVLRWLLRMWLSGLADDDRRAFVKDAMTSWKRVCMKRLNDDLKKHQEMMMTKVGRSLNGVVNDGEAIRLRFTTDLKVVEEMLHDSFSKLLDDVKRGED